MLTLQSVGQLIFRKQKSKNALYLTSSSVFQFLKIFKNTIFLLYSQNEFNTEEVKSIEQRIFSAISIIR